jgi:hypothetical protein
MVLAMVSSVLPQDVVEVEPGLYSTVAGTDSLEVGSQQRMVIRAAESLQGTILIETSDRRQASLVFYKQARTVDRSKAFDYVDLIKVSLKPFPDEVRLDFRAPKPAPWDETESGAVDCRLLIPTGMEVEIEAVKFDVVARGPLAGLVARSSLGRFDVADIDGKLDLSTRNRRVSLERITGEILVATTNAALVAADLKSGNRPARIRNEGGDIRIDGFTGEISVRNSFGRIAIYGFRPRGEGNHVKGAYGPITLELAEMGHSQLLVSNKYEDIDMTVPDSLSAYLSLSVDEDGLIEVSGLPFTADLVEYDRLSLSAGSGLAKIVASVRDKGNLYVRGTRGD